MKKAAAKSLSRKPRKKVAPAPGEQPGRRKRRAPTAPPRRGYPR